MGAIDYSVDRICRTIPADILQYCYIDRYDWRIRYPRSVEDIITDWVIRKRVISDIDIYGGLQTVIPLDDAGVTIEEVTINCYVFHIPLEATQGRYITSALSIISGSVNNYGINYNGQWGAFNQTQFQRQLCGWNPASNTLQQGMNAFGPMNVLSTANVDIIAPNTIMVNNVTPVQFPLSLRCFLAHDPELTNLSMEVWNDFYKLCLYATQSDIYNRTVIRLDRGVTAQGQEVGAFKEYIDRFADAENTYQEFLNETWAGVAAWNDPQTKRRAIRLQTGYF